MFKNLKAYFEHNRNERNGAMAVLVICVILLLGSQLYYWFYEPPGLDEEFLNRHLIDFEQGDAAQQKHSADLVSSAKFLFNPNILSDSGYSALGFTQKEISTLRKYQKAGGLFKVKADFAKLYFVDSTRFDEFAPFIDLPDINSTWATETNVSNVKSRIRLTQQDQSSVKRDISWSDTANVTGFEYEKFSCNLNFADTNELKRLPGIGSFYASRMVDYRDELGGYHSLAQLLELWKMTPEKIDRFADRLLLNANDVKRLKINSATAQDLSKHPYISFKLANEIVRKRESIGKFGNANHLRSTGLLDAELCTKLAPYLDFE